MTPDFVMVPGLDPTSAPIVAVIVVSVVLVPVGPVLCVRVSFPVSCVTRVTAASPAFVPVVFVVTCVSVSCVRVMVSMSSVIMVPAVMTGMVFHVTHVSVTGVWMVQLVVTITRTMDPVTDCNEQDEIMSRFTAGITHSIFCDAGQDLCSTVR